MKYLSLFSGIGAHDLGFERAGWQCVGQVEIDPFCQAVLEKHWPNVPRWADVRSVSADDVMERCGRIDLLTGGFACQDISAAGKGAGLTRFTRSGITWRNLFRLAHGLRPDWLVIENVPALRTRGYDRCADVLERIGYTCRPLVVGAAHVGANIKRSRVWIIATVLVRANDARLQGAVRSWFSREEDQQRGADLKPTRSMLLRTRPPGPDEVDRIPLGFDGATERLVRRHRNEAIKAQGNANLPQVAELIARTINRAMREMERAA